MILEVYPKTSNLIELLSNLTTINRILRLKKLFFLFFVLLTACDDGTGPPFRSLSLTSTAITFSSLGEILQLTISAETFEGIELQNPVVIWSSENPQVVTVSKTGLVTSIANGSTEIIAHSGTLTATVSVVVLQKPIAINLSTTRIRFENIGDTAQLFATAEDALGNLLASPVLSWTSSDLSVATVSESGLITTANLGNADISVAIDVVSAQANITVSHWTRITAGYKMTCGIRTSAELYCWGDNEHGQVGDGTSENRDAPTAIGMNLEWNSVYSMVDHSCGILTNKIGVCWGNNEHGQVGDGTSVNRNAPTAIIAQNVLTKVDGGFQHSCAITISKEIKCWGRNQFGQLGSGDDVNQLAPIGINAQQAWMDITAGSYHTCGTTISNQAYCWGLNQFGQLGNGTTTNRNSPGQVSEGILWISINAGLYHTCGINQSGEAFCWGLNDKNQLGSTRNQSQWPYPDKVKTENQWISISAGRSHSCGLTDTGEALCWGGNQYGQLGDSTQIDRALPISVHGNHTWKNVEAGIRHTCGVTTTGMGYCWGNNLDGQLGTYTDLIQSYPKKVVITKY